MPVDPAAPGFTAVPRLGHAEPVALQEAREQVADLAVVIDHQDMRRLFHGATISEVARAGSNRCTPLH